ncbi:glycosyltransferase family 2 protein [Cyclobacterium sediminis]
MSTFKLKEVELTADFACVITVYKEKDIAWPLVRALLAQDYSNYHIYLVADGIEEKMDLMEHEKLTIYQPKPFLNSKVASLGLVLKEMEEKHSHVVVFDPDNLVPSHFLRVISKFHANGFKAVQGKRIAKNIEGTYAALDALGEYYYDFAVRNLPFQLGSSSTIAGSGMSIEKNLYRENIDKELLTLEKHGVVVAEDKSLQSELVDQGHIIAYAGAAIIFDEKITGAEQIGRQRGRWLNSYFGQLPENLKLIGKGLIKMDWNRIYFAIMTAMPPMVVLVGLSGLLAVVALLINWIYFFLLTGSLILFALGFLLLLLLNKTPQKVLQAIPKIPLFVLGQISGMLNIRKASKDFMATSHNEIAEINDLWKQRKHEFKHLKNDWK